MNRTDKKGRNMKVMRMLLRGSMKYFALCITAGILFTLCELVMPQILRVSVDSVIGTAPPELPNFILSLIDSVGGVAAVRDNMWSVALLVVLFGAMSAFFRYELNLYNAKAGETLVKTGRDLLYNHIQKLPWSWHSTNPTGDIIQRCTSDIERIKTFFQEQFVAVFRIIVLIILSLACMMAMNFKLSIVALVMFPIIVLYSWLFHNKIRDRFTDCDENEGVLSTIAQENLTGVRVVRAFGQEDYERKRFDEQNEHYTSLWIKLCRTLASFWAVGDLSSCLQVMLTVVIGSVLCVNGEMTAGEFISFTVYNSMLINPVRRLGRMISEMSKAGVSVSRIADVLLSEEEHDVPDASEKPMTGDISFENVSFAYPDGDDVLKDLSFTVKAGSSFGVLGSTGSGKSSLILLLCRLYAPTAGKICVGGEDIAKMPAKWVRDNVGVVLQEPFLFSRSIAENIGICGSDIDEIKAAAETACIAKDIEEFTKGYDTMVGERGVTLSGGQRQRVAMARMLTKKTPVIVFDDSLSAVDTETDEKIRRALKQNLDGVTNIIISHRITTLMDCDSVLVLEGGKVEAIGTPAELLQTDGLFRKIYDIQMAAGEEEA